MLEMVGPDQGIKELCDRLGSIVGVEVQTMTFIHEEE